MTDRWLFLRRHWLEPLWDTQEACDSEHHKFLLWYRVARKSNVRRWDTVLIPVLLQFWYTQPSELSLDFEASVPDFSHLDGQNREHKQQLWKNDRNRRGEKIWTKLSFYPARGLIVICFWGNTKRLAQRAPHPAALYTGRKTLISITLHNILKHTGVGNDPSWVWHLHSAYDTLDTIKV